MTGKIARIMERDSTLVILAILPVDSVVIGCSGAEPDDHGVDREPATPTVDQAERSGA